MYKKDCSTEEERRWEKWEATQNGDGVRTIEVKLILPKKYLITPAGWFHEKAPGGTEAIANKAEEVWMAPENHKLSLEGVWLTGT